MRKIRRNKKNTLKLGKGKKIDSRSHTVNKQKIERIKPTFTVVRKVEFISLI